MEIAYAIKIHPNLTFSERVGGWGELFLATHHVLGILHSRSQLILIDPSIFLKYVAALSFLLY